MPVHAEGEVVDMVVGIAVAFYVAGLVFAMFFDGIHAGRQLQREQSGRFEVAGNDVHIGLRLDVESDKNGIGKRFDFRLPK